MGALPLFLILLLSAPLCPAAAKRDPQAQADADLSVCRGFPYALDLLLLVDISGSITSLELRHMRELVVRLGSSFDFGPGRVQLALVLVSDRPTMAVSFLEPRSKMHDTLAAMEHGWGDTNSGLAMDYAREHVFVPDAGARDSAARVLLWITDGLSTDDVIAPARRLKAAGVKILVVSTGSKSVGLHDVASEPTDDTLFFIGVESLSSVFGVICRAVIDAIVPRILQVSEVTPHSFHVSWPRSIGRREDHLIVDYRKVGGLAGPLEEEAQRFWKRVSADTDSTVLTKLKPNTTYEVTLLSPQGHQALWVSARTTEDAIPPQSLLVSEVTPHSFRVSWPQSFGRAGDYLIIDYRRRGVLARMVPAEKTPQHFSQRVQADAHSTVLSRLTPNTTYEVTLLSPQDHDALWVSARTEEEDLAPERVLLQDSGVHTLTLAWPGPAKHVLRYQVLYGSVTGGLVQNVTLDGMAKGVVLSALRPNTQYLITLRVVFRSGRHRVLSVRASTKPGLPPRPPPQNLMLTDVTSSSLVASWARPGRLAEKYAVQLGAPGGLSRSVTVPGNVQMVHLQGLKPDTVHSICIRAVYRRGSSGGVCAKEKTLSAPMPRRQANCPPSRWTGRMRAPPMRRQYIPLRRYGIRRHMVGLYRQR